MGGAMLKGPGENTDDDAGCSKLLSLMYFLNLSSNGSV